MALVVVLAMRAVGRNRLVRAEGAVLLAMYAAAMVVLATSAGT